MKKLFASLSLMLVVLSGCSIDNDIVENEINYEKSRTLILDQTRSHTIPGTITIKYGENVTESMKQIVRAREYRSFTLKSFQSSSRCLNAEVWYIMLDPTGQPGPSADIKQSNNDPEGRIRIIEKAFPGIKNPCI